jgi:branched-subunit amino acid aminotransferase/4-amino-4-deoxychorismate lyase
VFAILGGAVVTPPLAGILPGVTRSFALERTGAVERPLKLADLRVADAAFLTTAGRGIVLLADVGGRRLAGHPLVDELAAAWRAL